MSIKIKWVRAFPESNKYGGSFYNRYFIEVLMQNYNLEFYDLFKLKDRVSYFLSLFLSNYRAYFIKDSADIWIRDFFSTIPLLFKPTAKKNIILVQHLASISKNPLVRLFFNLYSFIFILACKKADAIITISSYWRNFFIKKGFKNVYTIYPFLDFNQLNISDTEVQKFRYEYGLENKPIVYLGNCREYKGVVEAYEILKDLDVHLVTSGEEEVQIKAKNLNLNYKNYLCLLKASSVVLFMSKFPEGWGITAHEAMYLGTPVIGSGLGGNKELLVEGGQIISSFDNLKSNVVLLLEDDKLRLSLGNKGHVYAKKFSKKLFEETLIETIDKIQRKDSSRI